ncbi:unnamed protein product [Arctia plantaginis]|uniref:Uncharacterized protein n=1 Tax=Arctia plantaginis TaxID=874455 RepID=A0A8S1A990_ARCPL|nr:unnamed protein product [Arctia plantaginis]
MFMNKRKGGISIYAACMALATRATQSAWSREAGGRTGRGAGEVRRRAPPPVNIIGACAYRGPARAAALRPRTPAPGAADHSLDFLERSC